MSCELQMRVASCLYFVSCELRVALIERVASCTYYASCELDESYELESQQCELKPKLQVACFLLKKRPFPPNKKVF